MKYNIVVIGEYTYETEILDSFYEEKNYSYHKFFNVEDFDKITMLKADIIILIANNLQDAEIKENFLFLKKKYFVDIIVVLDNKNILAELFKFGVKNYICTPILKEEVLIMIDKLMDFKNKSEIINQFFDKVDYLILITDTDENIIYVNDAFCRESGYKRDELMGKTPKVLQSGENNIMFYNNLLETLEAGLIWNGTFHNKRKDNSFYYQLTSIYPVVINGRNKYYAAISRNVTDEKKILEEKKKETEIASKVQLKLLSDDYRDSNIEIKARYYPFSEISGDLYKWGKISDDKYIVFLADVVGHGPASALITTVIVGIVERTLNGKTAENELLNNINSELINIFTGSDVLSNFYCTAVYVIIDIKERTAKYYNCGHPKIYMINDNGIESLISSNLPIGLFENAEFNYKTIKYNKGSELFLYTDGIIEIPIDYSKPVEILETQLKEYRNKENKNDLLKYLETEILEHFFNKISDDVTLISMKLL
ncbi:SpoIIE family protein phosphatase [Clostridiaceae bacterium HSG29]|nr:SpoIIE family protein phosphatase [Clostridiaceae bacterium HSG29]